MYAVTRNACKKWKICFFITIQFYLSTIQVVKRDIGYIITLPLFRWGEIHTQDGQCSAGEETYILSSVLDEIKQFHSPT